MLVTTHYLDETEHCHRIAIINAGRLAAMGTAQELKTEFAGGIEGATLDDVFLAVVQKGAA